MSELVSLVGRGGRWSEGCGRLARECRLYCISRISPRCNAGKTWAKSSRLEPVATHTISRQVTWWSALKGLFLHGAREPLPLRARVLTLSARAPGPWRAASSAPKEDTPASSANQYDFFIHNHEPTSDPTALASITLQKLLGIDVEEADLYTQSHYGFSIIDPADIELSYRACLDAGLSQATVREYVEILSNPFKMVEAKLQLISYLNIASIEDSVPFFRLSSAALRAFSKKLKYETIEHKGVNRITYLTEQLQCPMRVICQIVAKHYFMRTVAFSKLRQVLKIMLDFQVTREDILNDVWAFRYSTEIITERLKRVSDAGVCPVKPWMIRCPELALSRRIGKEVRRRSVLGDNGTIVEYLSQRFQCDEQIIASLIDKDPKIAQISGPKMKKLVDFLLENGYTIEQVVRLPRVLFRSLETMQKRLAELQKYGHKPKSLVVFCKSKRQYEEYMEMIKLKQVTLAACET